MGLEFMIICTYLPRDDTRTRCEINKGTAIRFFYYFFSFVYSIELRRCLQQRRTEERKYLFSLVSQSVSSEESLQARLPGQGEGTRPNSFQRFQSLPPDG